MKMKKHLFLLSLGALALAGCTSSDVIDEGEMSNVIGFNNSIAKPSRSIDDAIEGDLTTETLDDIFVYGYYVTGNQAATPVQVFDGTEVSKNASGVWTYTNTRYWVPGAKYFFYAYTCGDTQLKNTFGTPTLAIANDNSRVLRFSNYICDNSHQHDLVYAFNEGLIGQSPTSETPNSKVNFQFKHILTKINAKFISEFDASYKVIISNVRVVNIRNMGNYDPKQNDDYKWNTVDRTAANKFVSLPVSTNDDNNVAIKGSKQVTTGSAYVLPYEYSAGDVQLEFTAEIVDKITGEPVMSRNFTGNWSPKWKSGFSYTYNIKVTGTAANLSEIQFGDMNVDGYTGDGNSSTDVDITFSAN